MLSHSRSCHKACNLVILLVFLTIAGFHVTLLLPVVGSDCARETVPLGRRDLTASGGEMLSEFGVMANSDDMRRKPAATVAAMMKQIGYTSVAISCQPGEFIGTIKAYQEAGIRVGAVYVGWTTDGRSATFDIPIRSVFGQLRNTGAIVMIHAHIAQGAKVTDERIAEQLLPLAKQARKAGVIIAIYPHVGFRISTLDQAARVADAVNHPSLGVCFNLCHYLRQDDARDLPTKLRAAKKRLKLVTINGAAVGNTQSMGWDKLIQPLNQGDFDLEGLLELFSSELKFDGPIFVQCYNLKAPARTVLQDTLDRWQELRFIRLKRTWFDGYRGF